MATNMVDMAKTGEDVRCHVKATGNSIVELVGETLFIRIRDHQVILNTVTRQK